MLDLMEPSNFARAPCTSTCVSSAAIGSAIGFMSTVDLSEGEPALSATRRGMTTAPFGATPLTLLSGPFIRLALTCCSFSSA